MNLLATGRFLTISPTSVLRLSEKRSEFKALPIRFPVAPVPVGIVKVKNRALNPTSRLFVEHARSVANALAT
jgi:DNA-binding transcriptional LysR family regulator